ncbi:amine sulfotransferase [Dermacentor silvarum]|uniref:amine sulfotransferase n=1 Tax=Dermacentor silvarum TaxID=543639 RepID=UPI002100EE36|nr:amine sulfotransferase [Dermacentor silvarum]
MSASATGQPSSTTVSQQIQNSHLNISDKSSMAVFDVRLPNGPLYHDIDGVIRLSRNIPAEMLRSALSYKPQPDDKFVVTYPKCGTTWTQHIVFLIFNKGVPPSSGLEFLNRSPFIEMIGADSVRDMTGPGLIKTHLPYHLCPMHPQAKYLYVCRNPKDTCVSMFYHTRGFIGYDFADGKFDDFFEMFISGDTEYGDYFDHVQGWYEHRNDPNVLLLHYEDMKAVPRESVLKIAEFFDETYHKLLLENEDILQNVIKYSDVKSMKDYALRNFRNFFAKKIEGEAPEGLRVFHEVSQKNPSTDIFIRKGIVGDWKNHFSPEQNARLEQKVLERLANTDLMDIWRKHSVM